MKKKQADELDNLISVLEDKGLTVNVVDDIENAVTLKLVSEDALDVVVNKLVELAVEDTLTLSSNSKVSKDSCVIYLKK